MKKEFNWPKSFRILGLDVKALLAGRKNVAETSSDARESQVQVAGGFQIRKPSGHPLFEAGFSFNRQETSGDKLPGIKIE